MHAVSSAIISTMNIKLKFTLYPSLKLYFLQRTSQLLSFISTKSQARTCLNSQGIRHESKQLLTNNNTIHPIFNISGIQTPTTHPTNLPQLPSISPRNSEQNMAPLPPRLTTHPPNHSQRPHAPKMGPFPLQQKRMLSPLDGYDLNAINLSRIPRYRPSTL